MARATRIVILGSTGSIGTQALEVIEALNEQDSGFAFEIVGIAAGRCSEALESQARRPGLRWMACAETGSLSVPPGVDVFSGDDAAEAMLRRAHETVGVDLVLSAIVGSAGLGATLAAVKLGIDVALANKETLVAAGELVVGSANETGARLLPVDSEHSAIWQCLGAGAEAPPMSGLDRVRRVTLTASGGPLRGLGRDEVNSATPARVLAHPTWDMGRKITVDCASLMNKALEVIEAHWLFGLEADRISVLVHPSSTVHSLVEFVDGSVMAQLGIPDMRTPIQYALTRGRRTPGGSGSLDLATIGSLEFFEPDLEAFPALGLAYEVIRRGGNAGAVVNAANEEAVSAFLAPGNEDGRRVPFGRLSEIASGALEAIAPAPIRSLADVRRAEAEARAWAREHLAAHCSR
ncbi:MAG TPA: 1-deoxy-D-xylulose-5-phosphate reductoisomerase [Phycisphaerales bacterium]|nr:1-deoxy-D-xylulose-5-phosphate reductoisomerase [Phycisphaerales bacterium]